MTPEEIHQLMESLDGMVAVLAGYKAKLVEAGFSEENSEYMAVEFHSLYIENKVDWDE
jgi:hypothetical protein